MQTEVIFAGFGGQGVLFAGQLLSYAALDVGLETTWIPSYGPEMRGGTANCTVMVSDQEIGSPFVAHPAAVVAFNQPSLDKFGPRVKAGGLLVVNSSITTRTVNRNDIQTVWVPGNELAEGLGEKKLTNMVLLGALLANLPVVSLAAVEQALRAHLPERHHKLLPGNSKALAAGAEYRPEMVAI